MNINFVGQRSAPETAESVRVECLRCRTPMWVMPHTLTAISRGARPFCEVCSRIGDVIAAGASMVIVTQDQLDGLLDQMEREREIVRSN
jgi:hypothetical protein